LCETAKLLPARLGTVLGQFTESSQLLTVFSRHFPVSGNKALQGMEHLDAEPEQDAAATEKHAQGFLF
jgi:aerotaxis receptor